MAKTNNKIPGKKNFTHEGAPALPVAKPELELRRAVASCLLWEDQHYESGATMADRIMALAKASNPKVVADLAVEARTVMNLRHVSLWLTLGLFGRKDTAGLVNVADTVSKVIGRADEPGEIMAMYRKLQPEKPFPAALKKGVAASLQKFGEYSLAKWSRNGDFKIRDVLRITHPKPRDTEQAALWKRAIAGELATPDTWETQLSAGADKKETFTRLLTEKKLGYFALIRNLRNMEQAGVDRKLVRQAILARENGADKILPFRFIAAAQAAPEYEAELDAAMVSNLADRPKLKGRTVIVCDVSGSMHHTKVSAKSDLNRIAAAGALAAIARELCEDVAVYITGNITLKITPRRGMALVEQILNGHATAGGGGIYTKKMCDHIRPLEPDADRMIVITDEQDCGGGGGIFGFGGSGDSPLDAVPVAKKAYMINVASYDKSIAYKKWVSINGFSESIFDFLLAHEAMEDELQPLSADA